MRQEGVPHASRLQARGPRRTGLGPGVLRMLPRVGGDGGRGVERAQLGQPRERRLTAFRAPALEASGQTRAAARDPHEGQRERVAQALHPAGQSSESRGLRALVPHPLGDVGAYQVGSLRDQRSQAGGKRQLAGGGLRRGERLRDVAGPRTPDQVVQHHAAQGAEEARRRIGEPGHDQGHVDHAGDLDGDSPGAVERAARRTDPRGHTVLA
ncbi:MAG: hypothetical protein H6806_09385 [Planctomycetes bacterium]|nr:hypothetical protein [Planctomycetota bacterium]